MEQKRLKLLQINGLLENHSECDAYKLFGYMTEERLSFLFLLGIVNNDSTI